MQSFQRGNATFDTGLHYIGGIGDGGPLHDAFLRLGLLDLPWQRLDADGFDRVTIAGETFAFHEGYEEFARALAERFPTQREALMRYADTLRRTDEQQLATTAGMPTGADTNAYDWLHEQFSDELLINVLSGTALKLELRRDTLPLFTFLHTASAFVHGSWRLQADGNALVKRLADNIRAAGGDIICNAEVTELEERDGHIVAALTADERYEAPLFISDTHPAVTCALVKQSALMKQLYKRRITRLDNTCGMFTAQLRLKQGALQYFNHNKYIYRQPNVWELTTRGHFGEGVLVSCPWTGTPHADVVDLLCPMTWSDCLPWQDTTIGHRTDDYRDFKRQCAERLIALAETQLPGLREAIDTIHTSTPLTYRDYNLAPCGTAYGIRKDCRQPMMTILTPRTPIPNLLLTGQSLMLHGLHGVTMTALFTCQAAMAYNK